MQAISSEEKSIDEILDELRKKYFVIKEINFEFTDKGKQQEKLIELGEYYKERGGRIERIDGLLTFLEGWHFNIRALEMEPVLRLNFEVNFEELIKEKTEEISRLVKNS